MKLCGAVPCWHLQPFSWATLKSCGENEMQCTEQANTVIFVWWAPSFHNYILKCLHQQHLFCKELGDKQNLALGAVAVAKAGTKLQCHKSEIMSHSSLLKYCFCKPLCIHASIWACCSGYNHVYGSRWLRKLFDHCKLHRESLGSLTSSWVLSPL